MKLNYTSLQHAVEPVEEGLEQRSSGRSAMPVAVLALHGQLPCAAFALAQRAPGTRVGYVQTAGGALPGRAVGRRSPSCSSAGCSPAT